MTAPTGLPAGAGEDAVGRARPGLVVRGLVKRFGAFRAVNEVGFALAPGQVLALIGPNGAGKSTCFNLLTGQLRPDRGAAWLDGVSLLGRTPAAIARLGVGRMFQVPQLFESMTVRESLQLALLAGRRRLFRLRRRLPACCGAEADALLDETGVAALADRPAAFLAYGDLKRVELALALAGRPRLLLMDEPTAGMPGPDRARLMRLVGSLAQDRRLAVLFVEHDMDVVFGHADRVLVLHQGQVIAAGPPEAIQADPLAQEVYLGGPTAFGPAPVPVPVASGESDGDEGG